MGRRRYKNDLGPSSEDVTDGRTAHDQIAQWVRFADTKATILTAGFGVVISTTATRIPAVVQMVRDTEGCTRLTLTLVTAGAALAAVATLGFIVSAIIPRTQTPTSGINRYAWPSVSRTSQEELLGHVKRVDPVPELWEQTGALSGVAKAKFDAIKGAIVSFVAFAFLASIAAALVLWLGQ